MTADEINLLKAQFPFPWRDHVYQSPRAGFIVQILAANGLEVPIPTMAKFLIHVTTRLSQANAASKPPPPPGATP